MRIAVAGVGFVFQTDIDSPSNPKCAGFTNVNWVDQNTLHHHRHQWPPLLSRLQLHA